MGGKGKSLIEWGGTSKCLNTRAATGRSGPRQQCLGGRKKGRGMAEAGLEQEVGSGAEMAALLSGEPAVTNNAVMEISVRRAEVLRELS